MIIPLFRLSAVKVKQPAFVDGVVAKGTRQGDFLNIRDGDYYDVAEANGIEFLDAKKIATGSSKVAIGAKMAAGFAATMAQSAVAAVQGKPTLCTPEQRQTRINICAGSKEAGISACRFYIESQQRCSECGCPRASRLASKWDMVQATCPKGLWPALKAA